MSSMNGTTVASTPASRIVLAAARRCWPGRSGAAPPAAAPGGSSASASRHDVVERLGAEAAADHEHVQRAAATGEALGRRRLARRSPRTPDCRSTRRRRCAPGKATMTRSATRASTLLARPGDRVLLVQHQRPTEQRGHHPAGEGDVAAHAEHYRRIGPGAASAATARSRAAGSAAAAASSAAPCRAARRSRSTSIGMLRAGTTRRLHPAWVAEPDDAPVARAHLVGHGEAREDVAAGAAGHDQQGPVGGEGSCRPVAIRRGHSTVPRIRRRFSKSIRSTMATPRSSSRSRCRPSS